MKTRQHLLAVLILVGLVTMACNLGSLIPGGGSSDQNGRGDGNTIYDENGEPVTLEELPQDFMTVLNEMVATGEVSESEALISTLKIFAEEDPGLDLYSGKNIDSFEGTELFDQAAYFLATSDDQEAKTEIERLLGVILKPVPKHRRAPPYPHPPGTKPPAAPCGRTVSR
jgi:hypothetical protein